MRTILAVVVSVMLAAGCAKHQQAPWKSWSAASAERASVPSPTATPQPTATPTMRIPKVWTQEFPAPAGIEDRCFAVFVSFGWVATYVGYTCEWDVGAPVNPPTSRRVVTGAGK